MSSLVPLPTEGGGGFNPRTSPPAKNRKQSTAQRANLAGPMKGSSSAHKPPPPESRPQSLDDSPTPGQSRPELHPSIRLIVTNQEHGKPLARLVPILRELGEINDFCTPRSHGDGALVNTERILASELKRVVESALDLKRLPTAHRHLSQTTHQNRAGLVSPLFPVKPLFALACPNPLKTLSKFFFEVCRSFPPLSA